MAGEGLAKGRSSGETGLGLCCLAQRCGQGRQDTGRRRAGGRGRINWALRKMDELRPGWTCSGHGPGSFVPASRVCCPGLRDNNTAFWGHGASWRRDGDLGTASSLARCCNKGGSQNVNQSMRCPRKAQEPTRWTLSLFLVVKQGFPGRAWGLGGPYRVITASGLGHGHKYKWRPRDVPHCGSRIRSIAQCERCRRSRGPVANNDRNQVHLPPSASIAAL